MNVSGLIGGLAVCHMARDYVAQSCRFIPEAVGFLCSFFDVFASANDTEARPKDKDASTQVIVLL